MSTTALNSPSPSASARTAIARGVLDKIVPATATKTEYIVLTVPGSNYQLHLRPTVAASTLAGRVGKRFEGVITAQTRRVDTVTTGGCYVEPVFGRPRRVQGSVLALDAAANTITVSAGGASSVDGLHLPIVLKLGDARQKADQFAIGTLVSCEALDGATIQPHAS